MQENVTSENAVHVQEPLISDLQDYRSQIDAVNSDARDLLSGLNEAQFNWRPTPNHWSIAECLDHLTVTNRELIEGIKKTIGDARSKGLMGRGPFRYGWIGNMFVRSLEPPVKMKFKAPKIFKPRPDQSLEVTARDFFSTQDEVLRLIAEANGVNLARAKVASPVTRLMKLSLGQVFGLIATHERRHLWQAREVKSNQAFPAAEKTD
jgi:DinB superfamily